MSEFLCVKRDCPQNPQSPKWEKFLATVHGNEKRLRASYLHSLGNLVLLDRRKNAELSNHPFYDSADEARSKWHRFRQGSYSEAELTESKTWSVKTVHERGCTLLEFAESRWNFSLSNWGIKPLDILIYKKS